MLFLDPTSLRTWMEVLDQIEQTLVRTLERTPESPALPASKAPGGAGAARQRLEERLALWQTALDGTATDARNMEEQLSGVESALLACLERSRATRQTLAAWPQRASGPVSKN